MNKKQNASKILLGISSITLSVGVWAGSSMNYITDPVSGLFETTGKVISWPVTGWNDTTHEADYLVTDKHHAKVMYLDGLDKGHKVSDWGDMQQRDCYLKGDTITNLHTHKSGVITGVKHQGTMDVMTPSGQTVRYNYVTFKVKPM